MRTYGRIPVVPGGPPVKWVMVETDANGMNDGVWLTTLIQVLKLNLNESPFYANYGIPAKQSVMQQIAPDFYVYLTQYQFSPYFANLIVSRQPGSTPTYTVNVTTNQGYKLNQQIIPV